MKWMVLILILWANILFAKICPYCGKENPDKARYCVSCGRRLPKEKQKTARIIIEPDTYDDYLRTDKYNRWKKDLSLTKRDIIGGWIGAGTGIILISGGIAYCLDEEYRERKQENQRAGISCIVGGIILGGGSGIWLKYKYDKLHRLEKIGIARKWTF